MKNILLLAVIGLFYLDANTQTTVDFEDFEIGEDTPYINDAGDSNLFETGNIGLPNNFTVFPNFTVWEGWAISADTDTETPGFLNQYSSISGSGYDGSDNYAVSFKFGANILHLQNNAAGAPVEGFFINNNTYAYLGIRDGGPGLKKFGGETGDDEDYFLLTIKGYANGELKADSVDFYLADYRFTDNSMDYIVDEWTYIDLLSLGNVDSLTFTLNSTDTGEFGMNTPAYFCMDNLTTADMPVAVDDLRFDWTVKLAPNPAQEYLQIDWPVSETGRADIYNINSQMIQSTKLIPGSNTLDVSLLPVGQYVLRFFNEDGWNVRMFSKM